MSFSFIVIKMLQGHWITMHLAYSCQGQRVDDSNAFQQGVSQVIQLCKIKVELPPYSEQYDSATCFLYQSLLNLAALHIISYMNIISAHQPFAFLGYPFKHAQEIQLESSTRKITYSKCLKYQQA